MRPASLSTLHSTLHIAPSTVLAAAEPVDDTPPAVQRPSPTSERRHVVEAAARSSQSFRASSSSGCARGQRELILPKRLSQSSSSDESRHSSPCRPPVSYKLSATNSSSARRGASTPVRVPPIRAFRSSSSRRSFPLDNCRPRPDGMADDRTLRALEGRYDDNALHVSATGPNLRQQGPSGDDTGDVFLRIAREEPARGAADDANADTKQNSFVAFQDPNPDNSGYGRRRASITDGNSPVATSRSSSHKSSATGPSHHKAYNSSPLVRTYDSQNRPSPEQPHGIEGTESTASTTAPSTVWDELDELKSRIHRLEHTGKLPSSSGTATSRLSDERPATATTTGTTISLSPNRQAGRSAEMASNVSSQKEAHHILHSALAKSRPFLNPDVYRALESAAHDAMGLSALMGSTGTPGPISSGASTIGSGGNVTDRQLRRKADGVCRSLTELCVALGEDAAALPRSAHSTQLTFPVGQLDGPVTPTMPKSFSGLPVPRRASVATEQALPKSNSSPRALSRLEERRNSLLNGTTLLTPHTSSPNRSTMGDLPNASRRSSLMVTRTRRAGAEEPEDGRNTSLLRTRRAGTEEPDEGRRTSLLVRNRRGTVGEEGDEARFHAPSRANTDINMMRKQGHDHSPDAQITPPDPMARSATGLSGRRFVSTTLHSSRLAAPAGGSPALPRRYLERSVADHDTPARASEEHGPRAPPLSQGISHLRANSLSIKRLSRDSMISATSSATMAGGYR
ncbi:LPXTG-motif cell wall anchor domain protein [Hirsutella rhossiliensis]|uniref:LPXTG-motif cell wall anchor domain protein n=1 Tax=Hirsutella rhossiliensis TaxID=111463 RepID=A0A9P8MXZ6_9HYPO|nr:LPXTG-motif cell wall anchor domain protein [Hirsutella rhossiliensis]KAH0963022.1 LPXTG-motif cell wall anchor domain protein [Hirsutella rhossiliensis]